VSFQNFSDTPAQNRANQYIRVEHHHSGSGLSTLAAHLFKVVYRFLFGYAACGEEHIALCGRFPQSGQVRRILLRTRRYVVPHRLAVPRDRTLRGTSSVSPETREHQPFAFA
jgi:hypothetical protein